MKRIVLIFLVFFVAIFGCKKKPEQENLPPAMILVADPYLELIQQEAEQYMSLYPKVKITVSSTTTRDAIVQLLNNNVRTIIVDRPFNKEEREVINNSSIMIRESVIAKDGIAVVVNKKNPTTQITIEQVYGIVSGEIKEWKEIDNPNSMGLIDLVLTGRNSGIYEFLKDSIFRLSEMIIPTTLANNQNGVIEKVYQNSTSIGFVASSLAYKSKDKVKILAIQIGKDKGKKGYLPGQQEIHISLYPFKYSLYLYSTDPNPAVGLGFGAMILSNIGQKIVQTAGLVPEIIPYRSIQLKSE